MKRLTLAQLPVVMVAILALDADEQAAVREAIEEFTGMTQGALAGRFADYLNGVLRRPKDDREEFAKRLNDALDDLHSRDAFGTEGQNDPRGDHRR